MLIVAYEALEESERDGFRLDLHSHVNNYSFLTQIAIYNDPMLEGLYLLCVYLLNFLAALDILIISPNLANLL